MPSVTGYPRATTAYVWSFENDAGNQAHVAVVGVPPINSALDAVRAAIAAEVQGPTTRARTRNLVSSMVTTKILGVGSGHNLQ